MPVIELSTPRGLRRIGPGEPVFVIAELSGNHNQDFQRALDLVDAAVDAGADAIKLQTYTADTMTIRCERPEFRVGGKGPWAGKSLHELYEWAHTPWEWQAELKARAEARGVPLFSSPFDATAVEFLESLGVGMYKVASFEIGDVALLEKIGQTRKPVIISRGMSSTEEIELALRTLTNAGCPAVAVLHCVSAYPAAPEQMHLRTIADLADRFGVVAGLSDHTLGTHVALASVALGACIIEKHFTLRRSDGGPDAEFSLEPSEFRHLVESVREVSSALGAPNYEVVPLEQQNLVFRRSLYVVADMAAGERFSERNLRAIRPGYGLAPRFLPAVIGRSATRAIARGTPLAEELVEGGLHAGSEKAAAAEGS